MAGVNYSPPPTLRRFMLDDARVRVVAGPVGSGKSSCCAVEIVRRAAQQVQDKDGMRRTRFAVVRNTRPQLKTTTIKTWLDWFPHGKAGVWHATDSVFELKIGDVHSEVHFRPLDGEDDIANLLSLELTGIYINEMRELRPDVMRAIVATKRVGRFPSKKNGPGATWSGIWGDTNPPNIGTWWYYMMEGMSPEPSPFTDIHEPAPNGWAVFRQPSGRSPQAENIANLPDDYYDTTGMSEEDIRVYIDGEYGRQKGGKPIWTMFKSSEHVATQFLLPSAHLETVIGFDPGMHSAAIFMQETMHGQLQVLDEVVEHGMGAQRLFDERLRPLIRSRYGSSMGIIVNSDPSGDSRVPTDEQTVVRVLRKCGLTVKTCHTNVIAARLASIDSRLCRRTSVGSALLVSPHLKHTIEAMAGGYRWKLRRKGEIGDEPEKNTDSHPADALQYGALYYDRRQEKEARSVALPARLRGFRPADRHTGY